MSKNRFDLLMKYFHVADNANLTEGDKYAKVRPLIIHHQIKPTLNEIIPAPKRPLCGWIHDSVLWERSLKQHIHGRPIRFGYKMWSLCTPLKLCSAYRTVSRGRFWCKSRSWPFNPIAEECFFSYLYGQFFHWVKNTVWPQINWNLQQERSEPTGLEIVQFDLMQ